jgi:hypothetical protein
MNIHFYQFDDDLMAHEIELQERLEQSERLHTSPEKRLTAKLEAIVRRMLAALGNQMAIWGHKLQEWAKKPVDAQAAHQP